MCTRGQRPVRGVKGTYYFAMLSLPFVTETSATCQTHPKFTGDCRAILHVLQWQKPENMGLAPALTSISHVAQGQVYERAFDSDMIGTFRFVASMDDESQSAVE